MERGSACQTSQAMEPVGADAAEIAAKFSDAARSAPHDVGGERPLLAQSVHWLGDRF